MLRDRGRRRSKLSQLALVVFHAFFERRLLLAWHALRESPSSFVALVFCARQGNFELVSLRFGSLEQESEGAHSEQRGEHEEASEPPARLLPARRLRPKRFGMLIRDPHHLELRLCFGVDTRGCLHGEGLCLHTCTPGFFETRRFTPALRLGTKLRARRLLGFGFGFESFSKHALFCHAPLLLFIANARLFEGEKFLERDERRSLRASLSSRHAPMDTTTLGFLGTYSAGDGSGVCAR